MGQFIFPLQQLLDLRQHAEDEARCQLAESQRETSRHRDRLACLEEACADARREAAPAAGEPLRPGMLLNNGLYLSRLRLLASEQQANVHRSHAREQADRGALVEKARHRNVLERLKERRQEQHVAAEERREARRLDEAATLGFARRNR